MDLPFPVDDLTLIADRSAAPADVVRRHRTGGADRLAVWDHQVTAAARAVGDGPDLAVLVVSSVGAGGLLGLAGREPGGVRVEAVQSTLRDLDDLAGNAARVLAAADALADRTAEEFEVYVGLPSAPGWERAADVVEAAGHHAAITADEDRRALVAQLSGLVERDCPFTVHRTGPGPSWWGVVAAVSALIDDASPIEAEHLLDSDRSAFDDAALTRIRRRLTRVGRIPSADDAR